MTRLLGTPVKSQLRVVLYSAYVREAREEIEEDEPDREGNLPIAHGEERR